MILLRAYIRRKRFEARMVAAELSKIFAGSGRAGAGAANGRVSPDAMMTMMGVSF